MTISDLRNAAADSGVTETAAGAPLRPKQKRTWRSDSVYVALAIIFAYCLAPFYWMIVSSLRRTADIFDNTLLPAPFSLENYFKVFDGSTMFPDRHLPCGRAVPPAGGMASGLGAAVEVYYGALGELPKYFIPYPIELLHKSNCDHVPLVAP